LIAALVVLAGALALLAYVAAPLRGSGDKRIPEGDGARDDAEADKRVALVSLLELEQDRDSGKLTDSDYESLKRDYEVEAVAALRRLDDVDDTQPDDELETEIARIKSQLKCPSCGAPRGGGSRCAQCGA
jgi:hypothetical protein